MENKMLKSATWATADYVELADSLRVVSPSLLYFSFVLAAFNRIQTPSFIKNE